MSSKLHLGCPHRHAAIRPAGLLWLHGPGLIKLAVHAANAFNLNHLHSRSFSNRPCSLAVALTLVLVAEVHVSVMSTWTFNYCEIFECSHLSGRSKQTSIHMHAQCSHTSVRLTQVYPNYILVTSNSWVAQRGFEINVCWVEWSTSVNCTGSHLASTALALTKELAVLFLSRKPAYFTVTIFSFKFLLQVFEETLWVLLIIKALRRN